MLSAKQRRRLRAKAVGLGLFILPIPLLFKAVFSLWGDDPGMLVAAGGGWLLFLGAAILCRRGVQAELLQADRPFASRYGTRMKTAGGVLTALATALTALFAAGHSIPIAVTFGLVAGLGYYLLYGSDRAALPAAATEGADAEEAAAMLRDAYQRLDGIEEASRRIASPEFRQRLGNIVGGAERILRLIAEDPRDLRRARKFLTVYLDGAHRIAHDYARTHAEAGSPALEHTFRTLLVDMENTCEEQYRKLLTHDVSDLEVQIEVLSTRLRREGVI
jgi:5-bromo-4-chloroindolyl phosphate hydrolysis protein